MSCCDPIISPFSGQSSITIEYGAIRQEQYGSRPNVQVYIYDGTDYVLSDDMNEIRFADDQITVDFGGIQSGFVKVF